MFRACHGSLTARGPPATRDSAAGGVAFRFRRQRRHPELCDYAAQYPGLHVPIPTLRRCPHEHRRTVQGRRGSLLLRRRALPSLPPCRFIPALLRAGPPACRHRYSTPHSFCCSTRSLSPPVAFAGHRRQYQHTPSHVPCSSCRSGSRRLHTGHRLASKRVSARLIPRISTDLGFDVVSCISMLRRRFALARLPDPCLTAFTPPFPSSLTTPVFSLCSMRWLDISPRRAMPKGHKTFIYYIALLPRDRPTLRPPIRRRGARGSTPFLA